jgi:hypothetical protein
MIPPVRVRSCSPFHLPPPNPTQPNPTHPIIHHPCPPIGPPPCPDPDPGRPCLSGPVSVTIPRVYVCRLPRGGETRLTSLGSWLGHSPSSPPPRHPSLNSLSLSTIFTFFTRSCPLLSSSTARPPAAPHSSHPLSRSISISASSSSLHSPPPSPCPTHPVYPCPGQLTVSSLLHFQSRYEMGSFPVFCFSARYCVRCLLKWFFHKSFIYIYILE